MCGIFGLYLPESSSLRGAQLKHLIDRLFVLSEARGKEAAGIAVKTNDGITVFKDAQAASKMIATQDYTTFISEEVGTPGPIALTGHARLVTNGLQNMTINNQPVVKGRLVGVHNGIITNDRELWKLCPSHSRETEVDTEALLALIDSLANDAQSIPNALGQSFVHIEGNASLLLLSPDMDGVIGATNNGSLYWAELSDGSGVIMASEKYILLQLFDEKSQHTLKEINHLSAGNGVLVIPGKQHVDVQTFALDATVPKPSPGISRRLKVKDLSVRHEEARENMRRCSRCVLPETMPFIFFDDEGVCNYCRNYEKMPIKSKDEALDFMRPYRRADNDADSLLMLSGGRDSCYGLHYAVTELDLKPIAYTYDWGMVTDIARRNSSRLCGKLGVEHIIVSADIAWKRKNIRKNIQAWLKKPTLGMVPLFMAGDKQYFYYARKVREANNLPISIVSENPLELSRFKAGFCGVDESRNRIFNIPAAKKLQLAAYYAEQYLRNPAYINSTLLDNTFAFWASYFMPHDHFFLFDYVRWEEGPLLNTLIDEYGWELDPGCASSWRIGDGTAAFYNYIYYTVAGFTENDTLRSNQIREGDLAREEALELVRKENQPRWDALEWYASVVGFNLLEALQGINAMPKLYANACCR